VIIIAAGLAAFALLFGFWWVCVGLYGIYNQLKRLADHFDKESR
jgi:hypothetical protein